MSHFIGDVLVKCNTYTNESYHFDSYGVNETYDLQRIYVSSQTWSSEVRIHFSLNTNFVIEK